MDIKFIEAGYCTHPEFIVKKGGSFKPSIFPSTVALINHPSKGYILFDTGYSHNFYTATAHFPEKLYALLTPVYVTPEATAAYQLKLHGIDPEDIKHVIISHFHADHVAGIRDFPSAQYHFIDEAYRNVVTLNRFAQVKNGFLKDLLPENFEKRAHAISKSEQIDCGSLIDPITSGWDIFNDGSIIGVSLPGHVPGHMGLFLSASDADYLLISDACWIEDQFKRLSKIHPLAYLIIHDKSLYLDTIKKLHTLHLRSKNLNIIPCHCSSTHSNLPRL
ncbi:MAG: MBL fold metallo-hydrolase [Fibrobacterales bacterium]